MNDMDEMKSYKVVCMGDGAIGKTCLLSTFALGNFPIEYIPTIMDNFKKDVTIDGVKIFLTIWDTAGQEDFARIRRLSYIDTDCFIICFSVVEKVSLDNVSSWHKDLMDNVVITDKPILLVGTKCDLREDPEYKKKNVSNEDIHHIQTLIGAFAYVECSSLKNINNNLVFEEVGRKLLALKKIKNLKKKRKSHQQPTRKNSLNNKKKKKQKKKKKKKKKSGFLKSISGGGNEELLQQLEYFNEL